MPKCMSMFDMRKFNYSIFCLLFLFASISPLMAETEQETINKCLADLKSKDVKSRRRAVLILGKYQTRDVFVKLIPSLNDADAKVRESVVVGFIESRIMMREAAFPILQRLTDSNVHTRRMVSSTLIPRMAYYIDGSDKNVRAILNKVIHDKDAIVRKNIMSNFYSLRRFISVSQFAHFLGDESSDIKFLALTKLSSNLSYKVLSPYLDRLVKDKSDKIRMQVLKNLGGFGSSGMEYLKKMTADKSPAIAARAMAYTRNKDYLKRITEVILDSSSPSDLVIDLTMRITSWNEESKKFVYRLLDDADENRRFAALNALARMRMVIPKKQIKTLIKDDSSRIRKLVCNQLEEGDVSAQLVGELALSDYSDVREYVLRIAVLNSRREPKMIDALYDLMLDEELTIRTKSLQAIWLCNVKDKYEIFSQSLTDSEPEIRNMAARVLLSSKDSKALQLIEKFKKANKGVNIQYLQSLNSLAKLKDLAEARADGWQTEVKKALYNDSLDFKKAAVDITIMTNDPTMIEILREYLNSRSDRPLSDYLYKRISEEEK